MNVVLVGNYPPDGQKSMLAFAGMLERGLVGRAEVTLIAPQARLLRALPQRSPASLRKWVGYVDKFLVFPGFLRRRLQTLRSRDVRLVVHVLDHSNAVYLSGLREFPNLITCHDLLAVRSARGDYPENPVRGSGRVFQRWIWGNLRQAENVVCVSQATREDFCRLSGRSRDTIQWIPNALNEVFHDLSRVSPPAGLVAKAEDLSGVRQSFSQPYLFHVGSNSWYKNRDGLLEIYAALTQCMPDAPRLLLAGARPSESWQQRAREQGLAQNVILAGDVSAQELNWLYSNAAGLLFPSLYEGFGWPVLEAQAAGCPVFTTGRSPMTEVGGDAAVYFDPRAPKAAARLIAQTLPQATWMRLAGLRRAAAYTLNDMVERYLEVYRGILSSKKLHENP